MTCIGYVTGFGLRSQDRQEASPILPDFSLVPCAGGFLDPLPR